jgi:hypothetical protein
MPSVSSATGVRASALQYSSGATCSVTCVTADATPRRLHESSSNTQRQPAATASSASGVIRAPRTCSLQSLALMPQFGSLASAFSRPACTGRTRQACVCRGRRPSGERCCNRRDVLSADDARPALVSQPDASQQASMRAPSALSDEAAASPAPGRNAQSNATTPPPFCSRVSVADAAALQPD